MDSKIASLAVAAAAIPPALLQEAIQTAYDFHLNGGSAMYAFASNHGKIEDEAQLQKLEKEVQDAINFIQVNAEKYNSGEYDEFQDYVAPAQEAKLSVSDYAIKLLNNLLYAATVQLQGEAPAATPAAAPEAPVTASIKEAKVLISEDVFRRAMDECGALLKQVAGTGNEVEGKLTKIQSELQKIEQGAGGDLAFVLDDESHPQAAQWAQNLIRALGTIKQEMAGQVVAPAAPAHAPNVQGLVAAIAIKEAGYGEDTLRSMVQFARTNKAQLQQLLKAKGPQAVAESLKQIPGAENSAPRVAPAFVQWLSGAMNDSGFVGMLEHVFTKSASLDDTAKHLTAGALTLAGLKATRIEASGQNVAIYGLKVTASVLSTTAKLASNYGLKVRLAGDYLPPAEQPETYPEPPRKEPDGIQHSTVTAAPIPPKPSAAGNHAGAGNPVNPTGEPTAPVPGAPIPQAQQVPQEQQLPTPAPEPKGYGETDQGAYGQKVGADKTAIGPWGGEGYHVRQSLSVPGSYTHAMNGEGEVKVNVRKRGESILSGTNYTFPNRQEALAFVDRAKQEPQAEIISMSILWGGQWSLTNEWERDSEPMEDGSPAPEWYGRATHPIYHTAAYTEDDLDQQDAPECPACGGPGAYLGALGPRAHFRCQNCGMQFSHVQASKVAADGTLVGTLAEIESMLSHVQELADKAVAQARLQNNPTLVTNAERTNVKVYEALMAVRSTKADAPATTVTAAQHDEDDASEWCVDCSQCGGLALPLGALGNMMHYRCQNCGAQFNQKISDVKNPGAEMSYDEKEKALENLKGPAPKPAPGKDPRYDYKLPLTSGLIVAAAQLSHGPDASQGDNVENAIEFIKANGSDMDDYTVQQLREAMMSAGYTESVVNDAIVELLGQEALQALATPVSVLLK